MNEVKPALLTRAEIAYLRGQLNPTPDFAKAMRYRIIKKLKTFINLELPLLKEAAKNWPNLEEVLQPLVTPNSHPVTANSHHQNKEPKMVVHEVGSPGQIRTAVTGSKGGGFESEEEVIKSFIDFLRIDRKLQPRTVQDHVYNLRGFLRFLNKPINQITVDDVREYLKRYVDGNVCTYGNKIKTLRRFLGDFLGYSWIRGFKIPKQNFKPKILPSKEELKRFYGVLSSLRDKAMFLLLASSGLRLGEVLSLMRSEIDLERRLIAPKQHSGETKRSWVSCFNEEAAEVLAKYLSECGGERIFPTNKSRVAESFRKASRAAGVKITPQTLRAWFACEMAKLGISDRYIDAFCGRTPKTVLARHYTDYSPQRLKEIYDQAGLKVLS